MMLYFLMTVFSYSFFLQIELIYVHI